MLRLVDPDLAKWIQLVSYFTCHIFFLFPLSVFVCSLNDAFKSQTIEVSRERI